MIFSFSFKLCQSFLIPRLYAKTADFYLTTRPTLFSNEPVYVAFYCTYCVQNNSSKWNNCVRFNFEYSEYIKHILYWNIKLFRTVCNTLLFIMCITRMSKIIYTFISSTRRTTLTLFTFDIRNALCPVSDKLSYAFYVEGLQLVLKPLLDSIPYVCIWAKATTSKCFLGEILKRSSLHLQLSINVCFCVVC